MAKNKRISATDESAYEKEKKNTRGVKLDNFPAVPCIMHPPLTESFISLLMHFGVLWSQNQVIINSSCIPKCIYNSVRVVADHILLFFFHLKVKRLISVLSLFDFFYFFFISVHLYFLMGNCRAGVERYSFITRNQTYRNKKTSQ